MSKTLFQSADGDLEITSYCGPAGAAGSRMRLQVNVLAGDHATLSHNEVGKLISLLAVWVAKNGGKS